MKLEEQTFGTPCTIFRLDADSILLVIVFVESDYAQPYTSAVHG